MPSRFPWTKSAPAQQAERIPSPEPQKHPQPPQQYHDTYYEQDSREVTYVHPPPSSSQPSTRSNSAFGIHSNIPPAGQPYDQQHSNPSPSAPGSSQHTQVKGKSFKTRLGISSREELQDTLKEQPAPKQGLFGRKKSVIRRKEAPSTSRQSSGGAVEGDGQASWGTEEARLPPPPNVEQNFEPFGPDFTRDQLKGYHHASSEPQHAQYSEGYTQITSSPIASTFPQAQYQIYHSPVPQESSLPSIPPQPPSRRTSAEGSVVSHRHSQASSSRPSSQQSHSYPPLPQQPQTRSYDSRQQQQQLPQQTQPQVPRREDSEIMPPPHGMRQQRQSQIHDPSKLSSPGGPISREGSTIQPSPLRGPEANPPQASHGNSEDSNAGERRSPALPRSAREMSDIDVNKLLKDHLELRSKYNNVKRQYFEKKDQVESLQDSLAQQRLSQSRTCLDDGEYINRMTRLDGLVSQLAFIIRKDWKSIPDWLSSRVNRDAVTIGKQEMIAVGRAVVSRWLATELFDKYFHPGLEPELSSQLKQVQKTIWMSGQPCHTAEAEEALVSKIVSWRLTTTEGLRPVLASADAISNRQSLTSILSQQLHEELRQHLEEQAEASLEGGIAMIVELAVGLLANLPLESRDVCIEYFPPGYPIMPDLMKLESGIPVLERSSSSSGDGDRNSADSPSTSAEGYDGDSNMDGAGNTPGAQQQKKGFCGGRKASTPQRVLQPGGKVGAGEGREEGRQQQVVRLCVFLAVQIRGKMVLVKAPVYRA